jgi:MFS family permease
VPATPVDAERALRRNFGFDAVGALGTGLFNALVVNFLSVIARREGAEPLLLAALAAAPFAANMLGIFSGFWVPGDRHRVRYVAMLLICGRALFLGALVTSGPVALLAMGFGMWITTAMTSPLQVDIWRGSYPQRLRGRVLGYLRVLQTSAGAIAAPLGGLLIERLGHAPMLGLGALLGILGAAGFSRVRTEPVAGASRRFTPAASLRLLAEQPAYRGLILAWVVWGFGSFMATPLYALVLVDRFDASYADVGLLQLAGAVSGLLAYLILGHSLDRRGSFIKATPPLGFVLVALGPLVYALAPSLWFLGVAFVLLGVGNSAIDLGWQLALVSHVPDEHRLRYQAAHTSITGLRGVAAPFAGSLILSMGFGVGAVLLVSGALGLLGAFLLARALGLGLSDLGLSRTVKSDGGRPIVDLAISHRVVRQPARVGVPPAVDVDQVLLARKQSATADTPPRGGSAQGHLQAPHQIVHDPVWHPPTIARVDEPKEYQVAQQHPPVSPKST